MPTTCANTDLKKSNNTEEVGFENVAETLEADSAVLVNSIGEISRLCLGIVESFNIFKRDAVKNRTSGIFLLDN